jgi:hypothetical protein
MHYSIPALQSPFSAFSTFRAPDNVFYLLVIYLTTLLAALWHIASNGGEISELESSGLRQFEVYSGIYLEGLNKTKIDLNQCSRSPGRY